MNFEYNDVKIPDDGIFKISPSQINKFFEYPSIWYKEQILKEKQFTASTATVLGTIIHAFAEAFVKKEPSSREEAEEYITKIANSQPITEVGINAQEITSLYPDMAMALINEYVRHNMPTDVEYETCALVKDGVYVAGSVDNRTNDIIVDYKNVSKKPSDTIPFNYKIQLLAYAYADRSRGIFTDRIRLVYTVRPTKTLPIRVFEVTQMITDADWKLIEDTLELIADTVLLVKKQPELAYMLFKSMSLKENNGN